MKKRDPEIELAKMRSRFKALDSRFDRRVKLRRFVGQVKYLSIVSFIGAVIVFGILKFSPWPPSDTFRHIASFPNCTVARFFGLAPAIQGKPGYYAWHDADSDGTACEPWIDQPNLK